MFWQNTVIQLLPCHPDLNPTELIWRYVKKYVALRNINLKHDDATWLTKDKLNSKNK
jgi:transposase